MTSLSCVIFPAEYILQSFSSVIMAMLTPFLIKNNKQESLNFTVTDQEKSLRELRKDDEFCIFPHVFPLLGFIYGFE